MRKLLLKPPLLFLKLHLVQVIASYCNFEPHFSFAISSSSFLNVLFLPFLITEHALFGENVYRQCKCKYTNGQHVKYNLKTINRLLISD